MASCKGARLSVGAFLVPEASEKSGKTATFQKSLVVGKQEPPNSNRHTSYPRLKCDSAAGTKGRRNYGTRVCCSLQFATNDSGEKKVGGEQESSRSEKAQAKENHEGALGKEGRKHVGARCRKILCLSNGHGEDAIAVAILKELKILAEKKGELLSIEALPLVGLGGAYVRAGIRTIGPAQMMPSGGFLYMDRKQIVGDLQAGLMALTWEQLTTLVKWTQNLTADDTTGALLAVGDVLPLAMAWVASKYEKRSRKKSKVMEEHEDKDLAGREEQDKKERGNSTLNERRKERRKEGPVRYGFVGTAKSEFYVREMDGKKLIPEKRDAVEKLLSPNCVHLPWERALMSADECAFAAPRDALTSEVLKAHLPPSVNTRVLDLGNPMMDELQPTGCLEGVLEGFGGFKKVTLLPGSRPPEVHRNFELLLQAADSIALASPDNPFLFLSPIVPSLEVRPFLEALASAGWHKEEPLKVSEREADNEAPEKAVERLMRSISSRQSSTAAISREQSLGRSVENTSMRESSPYFIQQRKDSPLDAQERETGTSTSGTSDELLRERFDIHRTGSNGKGVNRREGTDPALESTPQSGWPEPADGSVSKLLFRKEGAAMLLVRGAFADCAHQAEAGLAMAGTATEQLVGLGKPVFTVPGGGPQFTFAFAEAQSRLLGPSIQLCQSASEVGSSYKDLFSDKERLAAIWENGKRRMGEAGASKRLAAVIWEQLLQ